MEVQAVHRELAYYLAGVLKPGDQVLVVGQSKRHISVVLKDEYEFNVTEAAPQNGTVDFMTTECDADRFDAIVSDRIMEQLSDTEIESFCTALLKTLKPNGFFLAREDLGINPKRSLAKYTNFLDVFRAESSVSKNVGFHFKWAKCLSATVHSRAQFTDICWLLKKDMFCKSENEVKTFRKFLDSHQYRTDGIAAYEWIFGSGFISPGGAEKNREIVKKLHLKPEQKVLDVGCGIMGSLQQMAEEYGVFVTGADLSSNMIDYGLKALNNDKNTLVNFVVCDICKEEFPENYFDAIYSRDAIMHNQDKKSLFQQFHKWLKPGGKLLFTDYAIGENQQSEQFKKYLENRQYKLWTCKQYEQALKSAGFQNAVADDITKDLDNSIKKELKFAEYNEKSFTAKFCQQDYDHLTSGWKDKIGYIKAGDQKWAMIYAIKQ